MKNSAFIPKVSNIHEMAVMMYKEKQTLQGRRRSKDEKEKHLYELEVHQIELELQNEELMLERTIAQDLSKKYKDAYEKYKEACEKYTQLYEFAPSGYFTLSREGEIIELNLSGAKKLGKARPDLKNSLFGFFVSEDTKTIFNSFLEKVFNRKSRETCIITLSVKDKVPIYVYLTGIANEQKKECFVSVVNITELKQTEQDLLIAKEKSEERDRFKSAFLANMSHEIRTPMHGIMGFTELLKKPALSGEKQRKYISMIEKGGERMLNIINDLIDISKIESGQANVHITACNVNEQIEYIYTFFKPEVERKGMMLFYQNNLLPIESVIQTDCEKILAILTNLVKNAIKYSDKGTIEFGYNLKPEDEIAEGISKPAEMEFFVKDTGIGIPQHKMDTVFDRFVQAHTSDIRSIHGAGLGLTISKAYVEILGGKMWVESEVGIGSTFYFTIPINDQSLT